MYARTQEMKEILEFLNKDWKADLAAFRKEHKDEHTVIIGNGEKQTVSLKKAVAVVADRQELMNIDLAETKKTVERVYQDTTFLRDANTVGGIIRRHKWLVSGTVIFILSTIVKIWIG